MQVGFLLLEFGHVQPKNSRTVILKNSLDNAFGLVAWFLLGSSLSGGAYGEGNRFIGTAWGQTVQRWHGALTDHSYSSHHVSSHPDALWCFNFAFSSSAATILSGAIAERAQLRAHLVLAVCICGFIYPVVAYWTWGRNSWLSGLSGTSIFLPHCCEV
jgi:ammonium transporter, Amt family